MWKKFAVVASSLVLVLGTAACNRGDDGKPDASETMTLSDTDAKFLQMMLPHHEQAIEMAELASEQADAKKVKVLALGIKKLQTIEIEKMKSWLSQAGYPSVDPDADHSMHMGSGGMLTDDQMTKLRNAQGKAFDALFLSGMIAHHRGAVVMAQDEVENGSNKKVQALAAAVIVTQKAEIAAMRAMQELSNN